MFKTIALHMNADSQMETRLQASLDLARMFGAHLRCVDPVVGPHTAIDLYPGGMLGTAMVADHLDERIAADRAFRERMESQLAKEDVPWTYCARDDLPERVTATESLLADLLIASHAAAGDVGEETSSRFVGRILANLSCPLLYLPAGANGIASAPRVLVAWNGSEQAARALRAAVPFLVRADAVQLFGVGPMKPGRPGLEGAARYVGSHGVSADINDRSRGDDEGAMIAEEARAFGADMIVMGAYGRSRLAERLLGGVTEHLVTRALVPLFLHS